MHVESFPNFSFRASRYCFPKARPVFLAFLTFTNISKNVLTDVGPPSHHSNCCFSCFFAWVSLMSFGHHHGSLFGWNERHNSSKDDSIVNGKGVFLLFISILCFWLLFPDADFYSFDDILKESIRSQLSFGVWLGHQLGLDEVDIVKSKADSIIVIVIIKI